MKIIYKTIKKYEKATNFHLFPWIPLPIPAVFFLLRLIFSLLDQLKSDTEAKLKSDIASIEVRC